MLHFKVIKRKFTSHPIFSAWTCRTTWGDRNVGTWRMGPDRDGEPLEVRQEQEIGTVWWEGEHLLYKIHIFIYSISLKHNTVPFLSISYIQRRLIKITVDNRLTCNHFSVCLITVKRNLFYLLSKNCQQILVLHRDELGCRRNRILPGRCHQPRRKALVQSVTNRKWIIFKSFVMHSL